MHELSLMDDAPIREIRVRCEATLASPEFVKIAQTADGLALHAPEIAHLVAAAARGTIPSERLLELARTYAQPGVPEGDFAVARFVLLTAGIPNLQRLPSLPVAAEVKHRLLDWFSYLCAPDREMAQLLNLSDYHFSLMCKLVRLERFPGGQIDWEISAFPRSWLAKVPFSDMPRLARCVFLRAGGNRPFFEAHTASRRELPILTEEEERKAYRLMALSMKLQPEIRGFFGSSWFADPELQRVSPHLSWLARWYEECADFGAVWTDTGEASPDGGFLVGDRHRRRLYEQGLWKPKQGLLVWPRKDLLRWYEATT